MFGKILQLWLFNKRGGFSMSMHAADPLIVPARQLDPIDTIAGFQVRPGFFRDFGATIIPGGVNFTVRSHGADSVDRKSTRLNSSHNA